ncbi:hypothetical protein ABIE27_000633 [Paenibacillus sp. 4624]
MKKVVDEFLTGKMVMILDNARIHHANQLIPVLTEIEERNRKSLA